MSDSALSSVVGLIPLTVATGVAVRTQKALLEEKKRKKQRAMKCRAKKRPCKKQVKRVTKSRSRSKNELKRWIG